jgi:hypothetical protein
MSNVATEILRLRRNQTSSVKTLLAALEWTHAAAWNHSVARAYAATEAADIVRLNVAIPAAAAEAFFAQPPQKARRAASIWRRIRPGAW